MKTWEVGLAKGHSCVPGFVIRRRKTAHELVLHVIGDVAVVRAVRWWEFWIAED